MNRKILVIDDSLTIRKFASRTLSAHSKDYQVLTADDGKQGLAAALAEKPDLILLDYILPDMNGDAVSQKLLSHSITAATPVILMSSNVAEMKRTEVASANVARSLSKPFTPELLCASVSAVLRERAATSALPPTASDTSAGSATPASPPPRLELMGYTPSLALCDVLYAVEREHLSGILRVFTQTEPTELVVKDGQPLVVTCRDPQAYFAGLDPKLRLEPSPLLEEAMKAQSHSSQPLFITAAQKGILAMADAKSRCQEAGWTLFAKAWTAPRTRLEFESATTLPEITTAFEPFAGGISEWAMESLRRASDDVQSALAWGDSTGIPAYTRRGYERIQQIPLSDEELQFASLIQPTHSLQQIARSMDLSIEAAQRILYRFLCLDILDYWPASLLGAAA